MTLFDPNKNELKSRAVGGVIGVGVAQVLRFIVHMLSIVVLSNLLAPADVGIYAMAAPVFSFVMLFQDLGFIHATAQKPTLTHDEVNAAFWISVTFTVALALVMAAASPLVGWFYGDPRVGHLTMAMGVTLAVTGLGVQHVALLTRRMEFGTIVVAETVGAVVGLICAVTWALISPSYWALFVNPFCAAVTRTTMFWRASRWQPGVPDFRAASRSMLSLGSGITTFNIFNYFSRNLDNILIGRTWGSAALGLYDRAYKLLLFPIQMINGPLTRVTLPLLSRLLDQPQRYRRAYLTLIALVLTITLPGVAFIAVMADVLIPFALGDAWADAVPIFLALAIASFIQPLNNLSGLLFVTQGRGWEFACWGFVSAAFSIAAFIIGLPYGPVGVALAYAVSEYLRTPLLWWYVTRVGPVSAGSVVMQAVPFYLGAAASFGAMRFLRDEMHFGVVAESIILLFASYAVSLFVVLLFRRGRSALRGMFDLLSELLRKRRGRVETA